MRKILITALILTLPGLAAAQNDRAGSWDFSIGGIYQNGDGATGAEGSSMSIDNTWGFGFYTGYHINNRFQIGADFDFLRPGYDLTMVSEDDPNDTQRIRHTASQFNGRLKATLNLLDGPFVPFVEVGYGWTYVDSNVADGPPQTGCWWHPWWGYICQNYYSTFSGTETSYGGALGLRYELRGNAFIKASYSLWKLNAGGDQAEPEMESVRLEYGWRF
jgi:opacity protein-like surface antigen